MTLVVLGGVVLLATLGHGYLWIDGVNRLHAWAGPRFLIDYPTYAAVLAFTVLPLLVVVDWWQFSGGTVDYVFYSAGILPRYLQFCALWGIVKLVLNQVNRRGANDPRALRNWRREPLTPSPVWNPLPVQRTLPRLLARLPGNECLQISVDYKQLAVPRLCAAHQGLRIAHLSDLHMIGHIEQRWFETVVKHVNQLEPDVIAVTGDILERELCWDWLPETLGQLRASNGVYFILGNHDLFVDPERTRHSLIEAGLMYVGGNWIDTQWNGAAVAIAGNERPWRQDQLDRQQSVLRDSCGLPLKLVLAHSPDQFAWACQQEADLVLAGHTHGGQIRVPLLGAVACPSLYGTRYACGVFYRDKTVMHVSRGISGETPLRWNCPPEIALLELIQAGN